MGGRVMSDKKEKGVILRKISPDESALWDSIVDASPHGPVFHTWAWVCAMATHGRLKHMRQSMEPTFHPLVAECDGKAVGLIPLYAFHGRVFNYVTSPPPIAHVTYLGPCLNFPDDLNQSGRERLHKGFTDAVDKYIRGLGAHLAWIRTSPGYEDVRPYLWGGYDVAPLYNYVIDLSRPLDVIWTNCRQDFRNQVRKAEREGFTTAEGSFEDVEKLYDMQNRRYQDKGFGIGVSLEYMRQLWDTLSPERMRIIKAELKGEFASATIQTYYKGKVTSWMGVPKPAIGAGNPNDLIFWDVIKRSSSLGCKELEVIGANNEPLTHFKTKVNPGMNCYFGIVRRCRALSLIHEVKHSLYGTDGPY
jgi:hypothetical protein